MRGLCYFFLSILTQGKSIFCAFLFSSICSVLVGVRVVLCVWVPVCRGGWVYSWASHYCTIAICIVSSCLIKVIDVLHSVFQHLQSHWPVWAQCHFALQVWRTDSQRPEFLLGTREGAQVQMLRHRPLFTGWGCTVQAVPQVPAARQGDRRRCVPHHPERSVDWCWCVRLQGRDPRVVQWP